MRSVDARTTPRLTARHLLTTGALAALMLSTAVIAASCSSTNGGDPCASTYAGRCGGACASDTSCGTGLYCGKAGTCTADCVAGSPCADGTACAANGRCSQSSAMTGSSGGITSTSTGDPDFMTGAQSGSTGSTICADVNVEFKQQTPSVMVLIDQSGSMTNKFGTNSRWDSLYNTLMNTSTGVLKTLEKDVRFGVTFYTSNDGFDGGTCPILTKTPIALNNFSEIDKVYHPLKPFPSGDTPTGESIAAVTKDLEAFNADGPKVIVLATDGEPDTCAMPDPEMGQGVSVAAAQAAFTKSIRTFIISVGAETSDKHLQDMANAGTGLAVGGAQNAPFYKALNEAALIAAFQTIIGGVRSCIFQLNGKVNLPDAALGKVLLDNKPLSYNDPNGWKLNAPDQLELVGESCTTIKSGSHQFSVVFPCGTVTPK